MDQITTMHQLQNFNIANMSVNINILRSKFNFWSVHGIINTSGLLQSKRGPKDFTLALQEIQSIHDSLNR